MLDAPAAGLTSGSAQILQGSVSVREDFIVNGNLSPGLSVGTVAKPCFGTLTVSNLAPALIVGDIIKLLTQPLPKGHALTIAPPADITFANPLAVEGSLTVLTAVPVEPPTLIFTDGTNAGGILPAWAGRQGARPAPVVAAASESGCGGARLPTSILGAGGGSQFPRPAAKPGGRRGKVRIP
jgi:hypothetical protein